MSAAAAPWVPAYEWRIWTFGAMLGLFLMAVSFALAQPSAFRPELAPLTKSLLEGPRPALAVVVQTLFWFLCAQLAMLISWYRSQCKLDFRGLHRVWPWVAAYCGLAAFCSATQAHALFGEIVAQQDWFAWRSNILAWLLPACVASLPLMVQVDRDVRRGPTTVYTLRTVWFLGMLTAGLELFANELQEQFWYSSVRTIAPLFLGATLFLGLWLHARVVAFVCPDPPECDPPTITTPSRILGAGRRCLQWAAKFLGLFLMIGMLFRRKARASEDEAKPKRRSRKVADGEEDAAPKRKRKAPAKRTTKPRTRTRVVEEEVEEEEVEDESYSDESLDSSEDYGTESANSADNEWEEEDESDEEDAPPVRQGRASNMSSSPPPVQQNKSAASSMPNRPTQPTRASQPPANNYDDTDSEDEESDDGESSYRVDDGLTADQLRGLTKRQKRELRQKAKDQQRTQRR